MKKILFITPTFARTGSEMVLWYLITNLDPTKYQIQLFSVQNGALLKQLPAHITKTVSYKYSGKWYKKAFRGILKLLKINPLAYQLKRVQKEINADLWFINTITIPQAYLAAQDIKVKVATYFHEMDNAFGFIKSHELERIIKVSNCCIGCSESVVEKIVELGHKNVKLQNSFINSEIIKPNKGNIETIKTQLGITSNDFVWVVSGVANYMKGIDLVLPVIKHFKNKNVKIIWIGSKPETGLDFYVNCAAEKANAGLLIFAGNQAESYYDYFAIGNGFLSLSREETFSLVILEAASLGLPIVAYKTGIIDKFIEEGMGKVVTSTDADQLCKEMEWVMANPGLIDKNKLKTKALEFTAKTQVPVFKNSLKEILDNH